MKHKIILPIFCFILVFNESSCKKFLEKKPNTNLRNPQTLEDAQALLDDADLMNIKGTPSMVEASADDYFLLPTTYNSISTILKSNYKWEPVEYVFDNDWSFGYVPIYNANLSLEVVEKVSLNSQNELAWKNVKGSALFLRAYNFLNLVWEYAKSYDENTASSDLGISLRLSSDFNAPTVRATVKESYEQILKDAKQAVELLPNIAEHVYRPSKAAACGLMARAYLSMRDYPNAKLYADMSLQLKNDLLDFNDAGKVNITGGAPFASSKLNLNPEILFYSDMSSKTLIHYSIYGKVDTSLYSLYNEDDLRKTAYFAPSGLYRTFKGSYTGTIFLFTGIATDEMYLIRAECYARENNKDAALGDLNYLLTKRWKNSVPFPAISAIDATDALNKILAERRKELIYRGLRWMDIKRLNIEGRDIVPKRILPDGTIMTLLPNANYYALPLPKDIIDLTGIPQNPQ